MNHTELLFQCLSIASTTALCGFVLIRRTHKILPYFSSYAVVLLLSGIATGYVYCHFGFRSTTSYDVYWTSSLLNVIVRSFAIAELCRYGLSAYRGIWALICGVLTFLALAFLAHAAWDAWGQPNRLAIYGLTLQRDLDLASVTILAVLLLLRHYYGIELDSLQRAIAVGIFFFCTVDLVNNSILRNLYAGYLFFWFSTYYKSFWPALKPQIDSLNDVYGTISIFSSMIAIGIWCFALRKPLPEPSKAPVLLPVEVYQELSPMLNLRLRSFNDRLVEMLRP